MSIEYKPFEINNERRWVTIPTHRNKNHIFRVCDVLRIVGIENNDGSKSSVELRNGNRLFCTISELEVLKIIEDK